MLLSDAIAPLIGDVKEEIGAIAWILSITRTAASLKKKTVTLRRASLHGAGTTEDGAITLPGIEDYS